MLKQELDERIDLQKHLFVRGYLITDDDLNKHRDEYPFYGNWNVETIETFQIWTHTQQPLFIHRVNQKTYFLIGHAYNPFTMDYQEDSILLDMAQRHLLGEAQFIEGIDELTGIFILGFVENGQITFLLDCSGMQYGCYGKINHKIYISSHMQLVGDLLNRRMDPYVKELISYRWYKYMMGNYLPGDLTAFKELKRIIPNTMVNYSGTDFQIIRFYPNKAIAMCKSQEEYEEVIVKASEIMQNNMKLIAKKWPRPAISLTGGIDSNTTFAAASGIYDRFTTFSYVAMDREAVDAEAARKISDRFGVKHTTYTIPGSNDEIDDFELYKKILDHNSGDIGPNKDDDTRKKIILMQSDVCDVEVKSWISETIRAYAYKYFGRKSMPKSLKPRHYTSLYKIFVMNRPLVWKTDGYFKDYLKKTKLKELLFNYDESDFFVWEMMHGGKCGLNITTMKFCFDITIPYNNRKFLDLLLKVRLEDRISDQHHLDMKKYMNKELFDMKIRVVNLNETKRRKQFANAYFTVNTHLPF